VTPPNSAQQPAVQTTQQQIRSEPTPSAAAMGGLQIDDRFSMALFRADRSSCSQFWGMFHSVEGAFDFDEKLGLTLDASIRVKTIDCNNVQLEERMLHSSSLNAAAFPFIRLEGKSEPVSAKGAFEIKSAMISMGGKQITVPMIFRFMGEENGRVGLVGECEIDLTSIGLAADLGDTAGTGILRLIVALEGGVPKEVVPGERRVGDPNQITRSKRPRLGLTPPGEVPPEPSDRPALTDSRGPRKKNKANAGGAEFLGIKTKANSIVYLLDFSGSMSPEKMSQLIGEVRMSIQALDEDAKFFVIFFNANTFPMKGSSMITASPRAKKEACDWVLREAFGPNSGGGTDPSGALDIALQRLKPEAIFLMTDGVFDAVKSGSVIAGGNAAKKVEINTICFHDQIGEQVCKQIAADNNGSYRYVPPPAGLQHFDIDDLYSSAFVGVQHAEAGQYWAAFHDVSGSFALTQGNWPQLTVRVGAKSLDCDGEDFARVHMGPAFLNTNKYPEFVLTTTSLSSSQVSSDSFSLDGELTIVGQTRPITVRATRTGQSRTSLGNCAGFEVRFDLNPADFGLKLPPDSTFGGKVEVILDIEGTAKAAQQLVNVGYTPTGSSGSSGSGGLPPNVGSSQSAGQQGQNGTGQSGTSQSGSGQSGSGQSGSSQSGSSQSGSSQSGSGQSGSGQSGSGQSGSGQSGSSQSGSGQSGSGQSGQRGSSQSGSASDSASSGSSSGSSGSSGGGSGASGGGGGGSGGGGSCSGGSCSCSGIAAPDDARRIAFLIEAGAAMKSTTGLQLRRMDHALLEVKQAIHSMDPQLEFVIIFYDAKVELMPGKQAVKPTDANKKQMFAWADRQGDAPVATSSTGKPEPPNLIDALRFTSTAIKPSTIFVLTAGDIRIDNYSIKVVGQALKNGESIQVINFGGLQAEGYLRQVAQLSGGQYQLVPDIVP